MRASRKVLPPTRNLVWSKERIEMLSKQEIQQLPANAESLGAQDVLAMCDGGGRGSARSGSGKGGAPGKNGKARRLISRIRAFEARGVYMQDQRTSWGGGRESDGMGGVGLLAGG